MSFYLRSAPQEQQMASRQDIMRLLQRESAAGGALTGGCMPCHQCQGSGLVGGVIYGLTKEDDDYKEWVKLRKARGIKKLNTLKEYEKDLKQQVATEEGFYPKWSDYFRKGAYDKQDQQVLSERLYEKANLERPEKMPRRVARKTEFRRKYNAVVKSDPRCKLIKAKDTKGVKFTDLEAMLVKRLSEVGALPQ